MRQEFCTDRKNGNESDSMWLDGVMGVLIGDALGNPVQFMSRDAVKARGPVQGMESGGVFNKPAGSWTDDGSMTLAALDSLTEKGLLDPDDMMERFIRWDRDGAYTPDGRAYDQGMTCLDAIDTYSRKHNWQTCGRTGEHANGNGGLMRILPVCLYAALKQADGTLTEKEAVLAVHHATLVTHNHLRACTASGIYYFMVREILVNRGFLPPFPEKGEVKADAAAGAGADPAPAGGLMEVLQRGMDLALAFYRNNNMDDEFSHFSRMKDLSEFAELPERSIRSSGYVLHTLEAAVWCLVTTGSLEECLLKAVNLGDDADTVGAVAGGLAGLYYGYGAVPQAWKEAMRKREWLEALCMRARDRFC